MSPRLSPYPPLRLELDLDDLTSGMRPAPAAEPSQAPSDERSTLAPKFDIEAFAREVMADVPASNDPTDDFDAPDPPPSNVRPVSDLTKTVPPPIGIGALYPTEDDTSTTLKPLLEEMKRFLSVDDFRSALVVAEQILADDPSNLDAREGALRCHTVLEQLYIARLGPLSQVPSVAVSQRDIPSLALDHRSGFVLALIDGVSTLDMVLDMCSMPRLDGLRELNELVSQGIIELT